MLGVINLDKPSGPTSHDMVALVRRLSGVRRIGHAGTLDPLASGVLPILVGAATRFSEELTGGDKRYDAVIRLGATSATDDAQGPIEPVDAPLPDEAAVESALASMVGTVAQRPPTFSARKLGGRTAHRAARAGEAFDLPPREVTIHELVARGFERGEGWIDVDVGVHCGPGTYVRSIARDLGERVGSGGYLRALRRTEAGGLSVDDAVTPDELETLTRDGRLSEALLPIGPLVPLPRLALDEAAAWRFAHGSVVALAAGTADGRAVVTHNGRLLGIGRVADGSLHPDKVMPLEAAAS